MKTLFLHGMPVAFERRRIKNINLYVRPPHGEILVTAPARVSEKEVMEFLLQKENWIIKNREKIRNRAGRQDENSLRTLADRSVSEEQEALLRGQVILYAAKWEPLLGVHCARWTLRDMKSRWGSCSVAKKTIRINLQLAKKPKECLEYVVLHELVHLIEPSHNRKFHAHMRKWMPDYKEREKLLAQSGFFSK